MPSLSSTPVQSPSVFLSMPTVSIRCPFISTPSTFYSSRRLQHRPESCTLRPAAAGKFRKPSCRCQFFWRGKIIHDCPPFTNKFKLSFYAFIVTAKAEIYIKTMLSFACQALFKIYQPPFSPVTSHLPLLPFKICQLHSFLPKAAARACQTS